MKRQRAARTPSQSHPESDSTANESPTDPKQDHAFSTTVSARSRHVDKKTMSPPPGPPKSMTLTFQAFAPADRPQPELASTGSFVTLSPQPDPPYIPRAPNAFILFRSSFIRNHAVPDSVEANHSKLSKIAGVVWNSLSSTERQKWEEKARVAQAEHRRRYPDWRFKPGLDQGTRQGGAKKAKLTKSKANLKDEDPSKAVALHGHTPTPVPPARHPPKTESLAPIGTRTSARVRGRRATISTSSSSTRPVSTRPISSRSKSKPVTKPPQTNVDKEFENARIQKIAQLLAGGQRGEELEDSLSVWATQHNDPFESPKASGSRGRGTLSLRPSRSPSPISVTLHSTSLSSPFASMPKRSNSVPAGHCPPSRGKRMLPPEDTQWSLSEMETETEHNSQMTRNMESVPNSRSPTPLAGSATGPWSQGDVPPSPATSYGCSDAYSSFPNSPDSLHTSPDLSSTTAYSSHDRGNSPPTLKVSLQYSTHSRDKSVNSLGQGFSSSSGTQNQPTLHWTHDEHLQYHQEPASGAWWTSPDQPGTEPGSAWSSPQEEPGDSLDSTSWGAPNDNSGPPSSNSNLPGSSETTGQFQQAAWYTPMSIGTSGAPPLHSPWQSSRPSYFPDVLRRDVLDHSIAFQDSSRPTDSREPSPFSSSQYPPFYPNVKMASSSHVHSPILSSYSSLAGWAGEVSSPPPVSSPSSTTTNTQEQSSSSREGWMPLSRWQHSVQRHGGMHRNFSEDPIDR